MKRLISFIDSLLPQSIVDISDHIHLFRARIMVSIFLLFMCAVFLTGTVLSILSLLELVVIWEIVIGLIASFFFYAYLIIYFKKTANQAVAANIMMFVLLVSIGAVIALTGGWVSPGLILFVFIPVCGFLVAGKNYGLIWTTVVIGCFMLFLIAYLNNVKMEQVIPAGLIDAFGLSTWSFCWAVLFGGITLYSFMMNSLNDSLNHDRKILQKKATFDTLTNAYNRKAFEKIIAEQLLKVTEVKGGVLFLQVDIYLSADLKSSQEEQIIKQAAQIFTDHERYRTLVSRYSHNFFVVIVEDVDSEEKAHEVLSVFKDALKTALGEKIIDNTAISAIMAPLYTDDINELTQATRQAVDEARRSKERVVLFSKKQTFEDMNQYNNQWVISTFEQVLNN